MHKLLYEKLQLKRGLETTDPRTFEIDETKIRHGDSLANCINGLSNQLR